MVGRSAAAPEFFFCFFSKIFAPKQTSSLPLLKSKLIISETCTKNPRSTILASNKTSYKITKNTSNTTQEVERIKSYL
ncbi:hypothetical protein MtrunA17_Chr2g0313881 [Medicago truncatula]|uniref:Uncharacterized protein n=1 Tax=Medicago truncatula TaxID=3880 RepID=A0A396JEA6_MEDTR|nr:hypothetical protein MtrunA17_Chr2g0313881 [Medicago truncatula]